MVSIVPALVTMQTEILPAPAESVPPEVIERARQQLLAGEVIGVPTETVYGLLARGEHEARLRQLKGRDDRDPLTWAVVDRAQAEQVADLSARGLDRLARRFWPGPLTLVAPRRGTSGESIGLRAPAHRVAQAVLRALGEPALLSSANPSGQAPATTASQVQSHFAGRIPLILDAGPSTIGEASSVVAFEGRRAQVRRVGLVDPGMIHRTAAFRVLLVCSGNTCRSPMAEVIFRAEWARRWQIQADQLLEHGGLVESAGTGAIPGIRASNAAIRVMKAAGLNLDPHRSQPLSGELVQGADRIYAMTRGHLSAVQGLLSQGEKAALLDPQGQDIADPIGGDDGVYGRCATQIREAIGRRLDQLMDGPLA